tara:strand:+ start:8263 stop:9051 length:789 start_codon:yes stop_codon:yes gene_type:complete
MNFNFKNKNVFISGGTHGIGLSCALALAKYGANIITFSRDKKKIDNTKKLLRNYNVSSLVLVGDALSEKSITKVAKLVLKKFNKIDILINNVGGGGRWGKENIFKTSKNVWDEVYKKNVDPLIIFSNYFLPKMKKNNWGRIVTISSNIALEVKNDTRPWFSAAKSSQISIMKSLSKKKEFVRSGITFNTISPGPIFIENTGWSDFKKKNKRQYNKWIDENIPLNRIGTPEDVSNIVTFICSNYASFINGQNIKIDGGQSNSA